MKRLFGPGHQHSAAYCFINQYEFGEITITYLKFKTMKKLLIVLSLAFSVTIFGQARKTVTILERNNTIGILNAIFLPDSVISIHWMGIDSRYPTLRDLCTVFSGLPDEFNTFLNDIEKFVNENKNQVSGKTEMSIDINGQNISLRKSIGTLQMLIYEKDGNAYHIVLPAWVPTIRDKFWEWCNMNNVKYN